MISSITGYPTDLLDADADLESDYGIDSIKWIEILNQLNETFELSLDEGSYDIDMDFKTINEIVQMILASTGDENHKELSKEKVNLDLLSDHPIGRYRVTLQQEPLIPEHLDIALSKELPILIIQNGCPVIDLLDQKLRKMGHKTIQYTIPDTDQGVEEDEIRASLKFVDDDGQGFGGLIYWAESRTNQGAILDIFSPKDHHEIKYIFFLLKHLKPLLKSDSKGQSPALFIATSMDGSMGTGLQNGYSMTQGGYAGLVKTLSQEWETVRCKYVDVDGSLDVTEIAEILLNELSLFEKNLIEIGRKSKDSRLSLRLTKSTYDCSLKSRTLPNSSSVFVVTGGGRSVTFDCILKLAEAYKSKFILIGRTSIDGDEPLWASPCKSR